MNKFFSSLHRITGTVIALFFLMWFVTGLVLFYHPYPKISEEQTNGMKGNLPDSLPAISSFIPNGGIDSLQDIEMLETNGQVVVKITTPDSVYKYANDTLHRPKRLKFEDIEAIAKKWAGSDAVSEVDTLNELAQWILLSRFEKMLPIYRFRFADSDEHEVFIAKRSGTVLQMTDKNQRFWAWCGAIPHKFYYPWLRKNVDAWNTVITIGGILCLLAALSGIWVGVSLFIRMYRKKHKIVNPYKKRVYRLHYAVGLAISVFILGWGISGAMSLQKVPEWMVPGANRFSHHGLELWKGETLDIGSFRLDYREIKKRYPDLKQVEWLSMNGHPVYRATVGNKILFIDAADTATVSPLKLTEGEIRSRIPLFLGEKNQLTVTLQNEYDNYYMSRNEELPLPVYRVDVDDEYGSTFYVDMHSDKAKYFNDNRRIRKWLFSAPHYLNIQWLNAHPAIWNILLWLLCICGIIVSGTGVVLGFKFLKRKIQ